MPTYRLAFQALSCFARDLPSGTTLLGATLWGARLLHGMEAFSTLRKAVEERALAFSDPFPAYKGTPLLPCPLLPLGRAHLEGMAQEHLRGLSEEERERVLGAALKALRREAWLTMPDFTEVLERGRSGLVKVWQERGLKPALGKGRETSALVSWLAGASLAEARPPLGATVSLGVALDRVVVSTGGQGTLFFRLERGWGFLNRDWGLTAWVWCQDPSLWESTVLPALRLVCDLGMGSDASVGRGRLSLEGWEEVREAWLVPRSGWATLLSPCTPWSEADLTRSFYSVEASRPWPHGLLETRDVAPVSPGDRFFTLRTGSVLRLREARSPVAGQALPFRKDEQSGRLRPLLGLMAFFSPDAEVEG